MRRLWQQTERRLEERFLSAALETRTLYSDTSLTLLLATRLLLAGSVVHRVDVPITEPLEAFTLVF